MVNVIFFYGICLVCFIFMLLLENTKRSHRCVDFWVGYSKAPVSVFNLQASLGTTKYCSYFLKSMQCPKPDCMYLHELGDEAASFTKEEMQVILYFLSENMLSYLDFCL